PLLEKTLADEEAAPPTEDGGFACLVSPFEEARQNDASGEGVFTRLLAEATNELAAENDGATVKELLERLSAKIDENGADQARTPFQWRLTSDFTIIAPKESDENDEK
ncbi:MAG: hypothetical protein IJ387_03965, partial [Thermoguttaceae bacterium]|nr:hypothetical protein [Thermoguttaceae bacterium]